MLIFLDTTPQLTHTQRHTVSKNQLPWDNNLVPEDSSAQEVLRRRHVAVAATSQVLGSVIRGWALGYYTSYTGVSWKVPQELDGLEWKSN